MAQARHEPVRLGIVGCGYAATDRHLPALRRVPEVEVVALADVDAAALQSAAERWGVTRRYATTEELVADGDVEAVAVCIPAAAHAEATIAALEAGKHVLVEKPLTRTLTEADAVLTAAARASVQATVGFNLRWHSHTRRAREALADGWLGAPHALHSSFTDQALARPGLPEWRRRRELGGGALIDKAIHHFDLWRVLLGDEVEEVFAQSNSERSDDETLTVTARAAGGTLATLVASDVTATTNAVTVFGETGSLELDFYRADGVAHATAADVPGAPRTRARRALAATKILARNAADLRRGGIFLASYAAQWRAFAAAIRSGAALDCSLEDGKRALQVALAAARSVRTGRPVRVAEVNE